MHYLITGGCGFIGSHLADVLVAAGHRVTILDNLSSGKRENAPAAARIIVGDITTPGMFDALVAEADGVFHLAAVVSVQKSTEEWLHTHQVNLGGTVALFDAIARSKRKTPVVLASSAAVYGDNPIIPLKETAHCQPLSAYGADKFACEIHARIATKLHSIPTAALRFFNVYGPRQDPASPYSGVISIFTNNMRRKLPVTIFGDGNQTRDFVYVGDVVAGLSAAMQKLESGALAHGVFNLCTGTQVTVNALAKSIAQATGTTAFITYAPSRRGDIRRSQGDPAACREALGFAAITPLEEGLKHTCTE